MIKLYTDGSCKPNPGNGCYGYIKIINSIHVETKLWNENNTTNNRMEYKAIIEAINSCSCDDVISVYSDSLLAVNTLNKWMFKWIKNGIVVNKKEIKNLDLVMKFYELRNKYKKLNIYWIKGHNNNKWNELIDSLVSK